MALIDLLNESPAPAPASPVNGQPLPAVGRNVTLTQVKGYLAQKGISPEVTKEVADLINSKFPEPLPAGEVARITDFEPEQEKAKGVKIDQDTISQAVLKSIGENNLVSCDSGLHLYNPKKGVWELITITEYQCRIQKALKKIVPPEMFTNTLVRNQSDITRREVERGRFRFDNCQDDSVAVLNGVLRFDKGFWSLTPHDREEYRTISVPIKYDPNARAEKFLNFLDQVFQNDPDKQEKAACILEMIGYSMMQHAGQYERFIILIGSGSNGKSILFNIIKWLLGNENCAAVQPSLFGNQFNRAFLYRKLVNIVSELQAGAVIEDASLKAIVSGESMNVSKKHEAPFDMEPFCTCWFGTNHMPHTRDFTSAMFRRATILKFNRQFTAGIDADPKLKTFKYWEDQLPGILNHALQAYGDAIERGHITDPQSSIEAKHEWYLEADQAAGFIQEKTERLAGISIQSSLLYSAFRDWASEQGISQIIKQKSFSNRLELMGIKSRRTKSHMVFDGIALKSEYECKTF